MIASEKSFYTKGRKHVLHGDYKEYYHNGQLKIIRNYDNGELSGKWFEYYESGQVLLESYYSKGERYGAFKKYYENGEIMIEANYQNDMLSVFKYGFPDGKYAIRKSTNDITNYYELYDKSGQILDTTITDIDSIDSRSNQDCKITGKFKYPELLIEQQLEGLVIIEITIGVDGRIREIIPLAGFHKEAIKDAIRSIDRNGCSQIMLKNGIPIEHKIRMPILYEFL
jgi:antitoxin component YwqK of YwqJK toxin-antitoxin module